MDVELLTVCYHHLEAQGTVPPRLWQRSVQSSESGADSGACLSVFPLAGVRCRCSLCWWHHSWAFYGHHIIFLCLLSLTHDNKELIWTTPMGLDWRQGRLWSQQCQHSCKLPLKPPAGSSHHGLSAQCVVVCSFVGKLKCCVRMLKCYFSLLLLESIQ